MASTLFEEDVVQRTHRSKLQLGLVIRNHDWYSSVDDSEDEEEKIKKGYVRVAWYPKGRENVLPEKKVTLSDRSVMPGDAVRRNQEGSQRGIVRSVHVSCHLQVIRTKQMMYNVCSQDLHNIMMYTPSCHVVLGSWIGIVRSIYVQLIVRLKNGSRCALSDYSACRLTDIHDTNEDDSVFSCDSFFPGQVLRGPASTFKNATWLSGQQPILSTKANFTVTVEEVNIVELDVHWQTRGLCRYPALDFTDSNQLQPPPRKVTESMLPSVRPLSYFIAASVQIGDKVMYRVRPEDLAHPRPVARGSLECFREPPTGDGSGEATAGRGGECSSWPQVPQEGTSKEGEASPGCEPGERPRLPEEGSRATNGEQRFADRAADGCIQIDPPRDAVLTAQTPAEGTARSSSNCCDEEKMNIPGSVGADAGMQESNNSTVVDGEATGVSCQISGAACSQSENAAQLKCLVGLCESFKLRDSCTPDDSGANKKVKNGDLSPPRPPGEDKQELLARAEVLKVGLSRDVDLLGELHRELCDASESVTDIAKNFRTLLQRATDESAREISGQVSRLLESQGKLKQQILMTEGLLVDSKKSLKELDDIEMETRGAATGKPVPSKAVRKARGQAAKNKNRRKIDDRDSNPSSDDDDEEDDSYSDGLEDSDDTDSNASSKGESRRHKVVSSLLQRHTKKQHIRLAPKRRPPPKPLEAEERLCVEVTHTRTLVDVMWQDGTLQKDVVSTDLFPVHQLDDLEFFPGDFVTKNNEDLENVYGLVCRTDHKERTCLVQWIVRPNQQCNVPRPANSEEVSVYELTPHPDFTFNVGDVIVRIADSQHGIAAVKKGKPDPKETQTGDPSCTQTGDNSTQGDDKAPHQPGAHTTSAAGTHPHFVSERKKDAGTQLGESDAQMGNQLFIPSTQVTHPNDSILVNNHDPSGNCSDSEYASTGNNNHRLDERQKTAREPSSQNPAGPDSRHPPTAAPPTTLGPITELQPRTDGHIADQQGVQDSPEAERTNVDRMNQANLQTGRPAVAAGDGVTVRADPPTKITKASQTPEDAVPCAGQVRWINTNGEIHVAWVDGSESDVLPQDLYKLEEDSDSDWSDNDHNGDDWKDDSQSEDSEDSTSSSWETASDASRSAEEVNIISPPASHDNNSDSLSSSPAGKAVVVPGAKASSPVLPQGLEGVTFEQTFSALSLVEDKMRRINSCANSILEKQTGLSLLTRDGGSVDTRAGAPEASRKPEEVVQDDPNTMTNECVGTDATGSEYHACATCTETQIPASPEPDVGSPDVDTDTAAERETAPASASPTEIADDASDLGEGARRKDGNPGAQEASPKSPTKEPTQAATGQSCDNFFLMEDVPKSHLFANFLPEEPKQLSLTMRREMRLLQTSLPQGIKVKAFADRMDLFSVLFEGPNNTPYEDGLFFFDARLPHDYPKSPPIMHYHAYCSGQLNPNLYNDGKVCVSLLGTWTGKGSEVWTSKSNLLQVLVSIQGLILVSEPYYNEAGYEKHRGSQPGKENSRLYNEMAVLKMVQSMTMMLSNPPIVFDEETVQFCRDHGFRMIKRIEHWLSYTGMGREPGRGDQDASGQPSFPLLPLSKGFVLSMRQALRAYRAALGVAGVPDS